MQQFPPPAPDAQTRFDTLCARLAEDAGPDGFFERLDARHAVQFTDGSDTLLVAFENAGAIAARDGAALARGVQSRKGVSQLTLLCDGATWFRAPAVYKFFDDLIDDGFFDDFARTVFYGAGPQGYAAAAFSVAALEPDLLLLHPQASLTPAIAGWDRRFLQARGLDFTGRYGFAPEMADAARSGLVLFDPESRDDFAHAALFARDHIGLMRLRHAGPDIESHLSGHGLLNRLLDLAVAGKASSAGVARLLRARRNEDSYLLDVIALAEARGRESLARRAEALLFDPEEAGSGMPVAAEPPQSAAMAKIEAAVAAVERVANGTEPLATQTPAEPEPEPEQPRTPQAPDAAPFSAPEDFPAIEIVSGPLPAPEPAPEALAPGPEAERLIQAARPYGMPGGEQQWVTAAVSVEIEIETVDGPAERPAPAPAETRDPGPAPHRPLSRFLLRKAAVARARGRNGHGPLIRRKGKRKL